MKKKDNLRSAAFIIAVVFVSLGIFTGLLVGIINLTVRTGGFGVAASTFLVLDLDEGFPAFIVTISILILIVSLIPLAWAIPMIIMIKKSITSGKNHIALGVCLILFLNLVSGILILVSNRYPDENNNNIVNESLQNNQQNQQFNQL